MQLTFENASNSKFKSQSQRRQTNDTKSNNREDVDNRDDKIKVFIVEKDENDEKEFAKDFHNEKNMKIIILRMTI